MILNRNRRKDGRSAVATILIVGAGIAVLATGCPNGDPEMEYFDQDQVSTGDKVTVHFPWKPPVFFAWKDGDGAWETEDATQGFVSHEVNDPDGRYSFASVGDYRGIKLGYYYESRITDLNTFEIEYDDTDDKTNYQIGGTVDNVLSAYLAFGWDFRSNWKFVQPGAYTYEVELDNDEPKIGHFVIQGFQAGQWHYKIFFNLDVSTNPTGTDYTAAPGDVGEAYSADVSNVIGSSWYQEVASKGLLTGTKVFLGSNDMDPVATFEKFTRGDPRVMYETYIKGEEEIGGRTQRARISHLGTNPNSLRFDRFARALPDLELRETLDADLRIEFTASYNHDVPGFSDAFRTARAENDDIRWKMYQSWGRYGTGVQAVEFSSDVSDLSGFANEWKVGPSNATRFAQYFGNRDADTVHRFVSSGHDAEPNMNGMLYGSIQVKF